MVIVEDDPHQLRALTRILRKHRESVDASLFNNGRAALLEVEATRPQLIVLDVFMPGLDGLEICRRLKSNPATHDMRVVLTSGRMTSDVKAAALRAGAAHVLEKPFDLMMLLEQVAHFGALAEGSHPIAPPPKLGDVRELVPGRGERGEAREVGEPSKARGRGGPAVHHDLREDHGLHHVSVGKVSRGASDGQVLHGASDGQVIHHVSDGQVFHHVSDGQVVHDANDGQVVHDASDGHVLHDADDGQVIHHVGARAQAGRAGAPDADAVVDVAAGAPDADTAARVVAGVPELRPSPELPERRAPAVVIPAYPAASQRSPPAEPMRERCRTPVPLARRAAAVLVDSLAAAGVEVVFGLPGGAISPVHDALLDSNIRVVTNRHESGAAFAAAGYAHISGRLGVCAVTSGPGALNALTGVASAWCDSLPMLLLVGEVPRKAHGRGVLQDGSAHGLKIVEMAAHISKLALEVPDASQLPHLLRRAITTALSGRRGPVVLTLPMDVTSAMILPPRMEGQQAVRGQLCTDIVDEVGEILRDARRPMILAGSGLRGNGAPALLRRIAERVHCPVATTPKGKGVFPENHPLSLGVLGLGGHLSSRGYLESGVDAVIVLGSSLGDLSTDGFNPALQAPTLVHVDIDGRQIGKSYAPTHAVVADMAEFLDVLDARLVTGGGGPRQLPATGVVRHHLPPTSDDELCIGPHEVLREIQSLLPADTVYTVDSGEHFTFATHYLSITHSDSYVVMTGLGSMGQSIGAAIGVKLAQPDRTVAAIVGDGCFAMNAFEVATAVAQRLSVRVFVFNDNRLGMVENGHEQVYGRRPDYSTGSLDVCAIAAGLGAATVRVCRPGDLAKTARLLASYPGPVVVDVQIDPRVRLPKKDRMAAFAPPPAVAADEPGVN